MIAITGASGKTGRAVVRALVERGTPVRALVGRESRVDALRALGAAESLVGDLEDLDSLESGLAGCSTLYHICPNLRADELAIGRRVVEASRMAGVERIVFHSVLHPQVSAMRHHWRKLEVEELLIESGLDFTILQPAAYMQNLRAQWPRIRELGVFEVPFARGTRISMIDLSDLAEAAVRVLVESGHEHATYELCGTESMDQESVASTFGGILGRTVRVEVVPRAEWARRALSEGAARSSVEELLAMFRHYEAHGFIGNSRCLESLLGRAPTRLSEVAGRWHRRSLE